MADTPEHLNLNFINGAWTRARGAATFGNENPAFRGSNLGVFQSSTAEDVDAAIAAAAAAFRAWRRTPLATRQQHVAEFLKLLERSREELARIVTLENGKTIRESRAEVDSALVEGAYHLNQVAAFAGSAGPGGSRAITTWVQYQPLGVVGVISPWNFPMNVMCRKTLPALLTGNTVVFKPASFTPWSGVFMAKLFELAGVPPGVFNCVTGAGSAIGNVLVQDPRVRAVSFTGSTEVGKKIQALAAANLTRTQLELGGKNALIVMDDADVGAAVDAAVTAGFSNAGQWCTSTSRLLLHRAIARPFLDQLVARCEKMTVGDGLQETTDMGPVAGPQQYADVTAAIGRAKAEGARLVAGGAPAAGGGSRAAGILHPADGVRGRRARHERVSRRDLRAGAGRLGVRVAGRGAPRWPTTRSTACRRPSSPGTWRRPDVTSTRLTPAWRTLISTPGTRSRRCRSAASSSRAPACPRTARAGWSSSSIGRPFT